HLVIAAHCHAEAPTLSASDYLTALVRPMLQHRLPAQRWIACLCAGSAGLRDEELVASLLGLLRSDPQIQVQHSAARAVGRLGDPSQSQLDACKVRGFPSADWARYTTNQYRLRFSKTFDSNVSRWSERSSADLVTLLKDTDAAARAAAAALLQQRNEAISREP